jgi:pyridine nucleotide-disulfide oxidoreductase family protein
MAEPKNLVLLGLGHTNLHVVHLWEQEPLPGYRLVGISNFDRTTYSGMLPGTLGKQFSEPEMQVCLEPLFRRAGAELVTAEVAGLNLENQEVLFHGHEPIPFDLLSIGVGSMPAGWYQHTSPMVVPIKPMQTFILRLEQRLKQALENRSKQVRIAIVGGGVAGVEIALCLRQRLELQKLPLPFHLEIFTASPRIGDCLGARAVSKLSRLLNLYGIAVHVDTRVSSVSETAIVTDRGVEFPSDMVIWATGAVAPPVLDLLSLTKDERGFLATKPTLQSVAHPRIFAVGDCGTIIQNPAPKAGVYAVRQCPILWQNLRASATGQSLTEYHPQKDFLKLINTGDGRALMEYKGMALHARWCLWLKKRIDKKFVSQYQ